MEYNWEVQSLKSSTISGVVNNAIIQVMWVCAGTDKDGISGSFKGATPFSLDNIDPVSFIPFESLTEEIVIGWVQAVVVGDYKAHVDEQINKQITMKALVVEVKDKELPWKSKI